jgi:peptidoglycan/LPS O-acetylase OafA/YrhL
MSAETQVLANRANAPRLELRAPTNPPKSQRIPALDFTKGFLVLVMVLYHWINYFIGPEWPYYNYLRFLTPSFIFITGFIVSNIYLQKYDAADARLPKRLFTRGLKLLGVFLALNLTRTLVVPVVGTGTSLRNQVTLRNIFIVFASGNLPVAGGKLVSFSILVPIGYLLVLSGLLTFAYRIHKHVFHAVCTFFLSGILALGLMGIRIYNLEYITIGMLGLLAGFLPIKTINSFVRHPYAFAVAYGCYTVAITIWSVPFPLVVIGVCLSVAVIYLIGASGQKYGAIRNEVILLGKYSLFGYISQIAILQILSAGSHRVTIGFAGLVLSFIAAFALTIVSVEVIDRARVWTTGVDRLYKAVFA